MSRIRGIRFKVTAICALSALVAMAVVGIVTACSMQAIMRDIAVNTVSLDLDEALEEVEDGDFADAIEDVDSSMMQIIDADGEVMAASPRISLLSALSGPLGAFGEPYVLEDFSAYGGGQTPWLNKESPYLAMQRSLDTERGPVTIVALTSLAFADETVRDTMAVLAAAFAVFLVLVVVLSWRMTRRTLRPVEAMRVQVEQVADGKLDARVPVPEDADLAPLALTFNDMLGRIEASVDGQRRFVSDASHELKSPLANMRLMVQAARAYPEAVGADEALAGIEAESERMARIVDDMLALARQDEGRVHVVKARVDMAELLADEVGAMPSKTGVSVDMSAVEPAVCDADAELLGYAVRNVLANALRYAGSVVRVACREEGRTVRVTVSDDGPGIAPEHRERVFDRFFRVEESRSRKEGSTGLGLAVARGAVQAHGGTIRFVEPQLGGATAVIELPLAGFGCV